MAELNDWERQVRDNNVVSHENIMVTLKEAELLAEESKDEYDQAIVIFYKKTEDEKIKSTWLNAGFHFSELIFLFRYLEHDMLKKMHDPEDD